MAAWAMQQKNKRTRVRDDMEESALQDEIRWRKRFGCRRKLYRLTSAVDLTEEGKGVGRLLMNVHAVPSL